MAPGGLVDHGDVVRSRLIVLHLAAIDELELPVLDELPYLFLNLLALLVPPAPEECLPTMQVLPLTTVALDRSGCEVISSVQKDP